ncbi:MAG: lipoate--protein ligase family protein [Planctomycetales bacterium]|nr:lipoate--protein ligase family protein [Planctomycetales bacterium]
MKLLDLTLPTAAENLALDEALLELVDQADEAADESNFNVLRLWEPTQTMVVVGRASKVAEEVDIAFCESNQIEILRRCSGGASIVTGPGCLMYSVVLSLHRHPELRMIERAHSFVLEMIRSGLVDAGIEVQRQGTSDLTIGDRKFSGNSLRCKRNAILYHGTLLCEMNLEPIFGCLRTAPRQPEYRAQRDHHEFVANLDEGPNRVRSQLIASWSADEPLATWPQAETFKLAKERYSNDSWNFRL